jgi:predicted metal-dependent enzyme (double-stranded beta helix superfamily)
LDDPDPVASVNALVVDLVTGDALVGGLDDPESSPDDDEVVLHVDARMTVFHIRLSAHMSYPPHTHGMPAVLGVYEGRERNRYFRRIGDEIAEQSMSDVAAGEVCTMASGVVHAVENPSDERSAAVHVYFGNLLATRRDVWNPETGERHDFDNDRYFAFARAISDARPQGGTG